MTTPQAQIAADGAKAVACIIRAIRAEQAGNVKAAAKLRTVSKLYAARQRKVREMVQ